MIRFYDEVRMSARLGRSDELLSPCFYPIVPNTVVGLHYANHVV